MKITLTIIFFISAILLFEGCVYKDGGAETYAAESTTPEGEKFIQEYSIRYVCEDVYELWFMEFYRDDCVCSYDVHKVGSNISYKQLSPEIINQYKIEPGYSFWEKYSRWLLPALIVIALLVFYVGDKISK